MLKLLAQHLAGTLELVVQRLTFGRDCIDSTFETVLVAEDIHSLELRSCELQLCE